MPPSTARDRCGAFTAVFAGVCLCAGSLWAQTPAAPATPPPPADVTFDPITVTATRGAERMFEVPASADVILGSTIRDGQPAINLSESLARVPGVFAANRNNYAQDLQLSSRGYGARATFGVRGVRLYQDDIPATMPDGQGQTGSFSLLSAQRIEVLRGPFSTLYGNASGGVVSVYTEDGTPVPVVNFTGSVGSYGTSIVGAKATGIQDGVGYVAAFSNFDTDGYREHSSALRQIANAKLTFNATDSTHVTLIANSQYQPQTQDPLGLTYAQWKADPRQADPVAILFNTSKTINQVQGGAAVDQVLNADTSLRVTGYGGERQIRQYLALTGVGATSSGGVVDLEPQFRRRRGAADLSWQPARSAVDAQRGRRRRPPARAAAGLCEQQRFDGRIAAQRRRQRHQRRHLCRSAVVCAARVVGNPRCALEPGPLRLGRSLHRRAESGRQRHAHLLQHEPRRRPGLARRRQSQPVRELRTGVRDADIRRNRLPA